MDRTAIHPVAALVLFTIINTHTHTYILHTFTLKHLTHLHTTHKHTSYTPSHTTHIHASYTPSQHIPQAFTANTHTWQGKTYKLLLEICIC